MFGDHSDCERHASDFIPAMECLSFCMTSLLQNVFTTSEDFNASEDFIASEDIIASELIPFHHISATPLYPKRSDSSAIHPSGEIQSIRRHPKSMTRSPINAQPFTDSGASISRTSQPSLNQKTSYLKNQTAKILVFQVRSLIKIYPSLLIMSLYSIFLLIFKSVVFESGSAIILMSYSPQLRISNPSSAIRYQQRDSILCVRTHISNINKSILTRIRTLNSIRHAYIKGEHAKLLFLS